MKMTQDEAIQRIIDHKLVHHLNEPQAVLITEALDMAVDALHLQKNIGNFYVELTKLRNEYEKVNDPWGEGCNNPYYEVLKLLDQAMKY